MRVIILVAHADDETLGAGATIQRLVKRGDSVSVVILSDGIVRARGREQNNRDDAFAACRVLGVDPPLFLDFPDQKFDTIPMADLSGKVAALDLQPDLIITHLETDLNRDHRLTAEVAKIVGRPRSKPVAILACEIPSVANWNGTPFPANFYVNITHELDRKIEAFTKYSNECQPFPHPWSKEGLATLAKYHGIQSGVPAAEAFHLVRGYDSALFGSLD